MNEKMSFADFWILCLLGFAIYSCFHPGLLKIIMGAEKVEESSIYSMPDTPEVQTLTVKESDKESMQEIIDELDSTTAVITMDYKRHVIHQHVYDTTLYMETRMPVFIKQYWMGEYPFYIIKD